MDIYHIWADKEGDISDADWVTNMRGFLDHLISESKMVSYRITRCKMGFRSIQDLPEWHIMMCAHAWSWCSNSCIYLPLVLLGGTHSCVAAWD